MKKHVCTHCGEEFTGKKRKYCNDKCRYEYHNARKRKQYRMGNNIKSRSCPICDKEFEPNRNGALTKYCSQKCAEEARRIRNRERWREANPGWNEGTNKVCEWCGNAFIDKSKAKHARFCSDECGQTWYSREVRGHGPQEEYLKELEQQKEETARMKEAEHKAKIKTKECAECGQPFETMQPNQLTCSKTCSRKRRNRLARRDDRINENNNIDRDISLETLYKRDEGGCYICGGSCDFDDHQRTDGHFICGPTYPSIDHIVPLARGGMHAWDNVKLAHHLCNARKSDILPSELQLDTEIEEAYALARKVSPRKKQVKQFTKDGLLIATYESTAEAERITGFKQRGIQSCARGEDKRYRGYLWVY